MADALASAVRALGPLPAALREVLQRLDTLELVSEIRLYAARELPERQATHEMAEYAPDSIAIGDDGGGRVVLLNRETGTVSIVDAGAIGSVAPDVLSKDLLEWVAAGAPLDEEARPRRPSYVDVYIERAPGDRNRALVAMRRELVPNVGVAELRKAMDAVPCRILRAVPYGKYGVICRELNEVFSFLGLREVDDPTRVVPLPAGPSHSTDP